MFPPTLPTFVMIVKPRFQQWLNWYETLTSCAPIVTAEDMFTARSRERLIYPRTGGLAIREAISARIHMESRDAQIPINGRSMLY